MGVLMYYKEYYMLNNMFYKVARLTGIGGYRAALRFLYGCSMAALIEMQRIGIEKLGERRKGEGTRIRRSGMTPGGKESMRLGKGKLGVI